MRRIKPEGTKPEIFIRKLIHSMGYRYRLHRKDLPGKPDMVFPKYRKVIFVNGCFWHRHEGCQRATLPTTNFDFWEKKLSGNVNRDKANYSKLKDMGWRYLIIWQCEIKKTKLEALIKNIKEFLESN